jgi:hypothetical protein
VSRFDVPHGHRLLVHFCEDCACPVSDVQNPPASADRFAFGPFTRGRDILDITLDNQHRALIGPHGNGGVAPSTWPSAPCSTISQWMPARADLVAIGHDREHADADLVRPLGAEPLPRFRERREPTV